jgi:hypothetical protein
MDKPPQMCSIVVQNIKFLKKLLSRVVEDFKLNVFVRKKELNKKWKMKIAIIES